MKNKRCLLLLTMIGLVLALSTLTFKAALASGPIEMKAVAFLPTTSIETKMFIEFIEDVQKKTGGVLKIKLLGGPEVIPAREQVSNELDKFIGQLREKYTSHAIATALVAATADLLDGLGDTLKGGQSD